MAKKKVDKPMSDFEKKLKNFFDNYNEDEAYARGLHREYIPDDELFYKEGLDDEHNEVNKHILMTVNEGIVSFESLRSYIENNDYIRSNPDKFKGCLDRINKIIVDLDDFIQNYGK